jgi:hypothetical protein
MKKSKRSLAVLLEILALSLPACFMGYALALPAPTKGRCGDANGGANQSCSGCVKHSDTEWDLYTLVTFYQCDITVTTQTCANDKFNVVKCPYTMWTDSNCKNSEFGNGTYFPYTCK